MKARTGRAVLVAVAGDLDEPHLIERSQLQLLPDGAFAPYHAAEGLAPEEAREAVRRSIEDAHRLAADGIREAARRCTRGRPRAVRLRRARRHRHAGLEHRRNPRGARSHAQGRGRALPRRAGRGRACLRPESHDASRQVGARRRGKDARRALAHGWMRASPGSASRPDRRGARIRRRRRRPRSRRSDRPSCRAAARCAPNAVVLQLKRMASTRSSIVTAIAIHAAVLDVDAVTMAHQHEAGASHEGGEEVQLPGLEQQRLVAHHHVAEQAAADRVAQADQHRGFRRHARHQRLVRAVDRIDADRQRVDVGEEQLEALGEALRQRSDDHGGEHHVEKARVLHHHRHFLQKDGVAQQAAAHAGDEGEHESADHVVAALGRRPDPGEREQEHGGEIEPDRQQE